MAYSLSTPIADLTVGELIELISTASQPKSNALGKKLLSVDEVAELLGYKTSNIYALTHRREIPFMKKGRRLWFNEQEILDWVKSGRKKTIEEIKNSTSVKNGKIIHH